MIVDPFFPSSISTSLISVGAAAVHLRLPISSAGAGEPQRAGGECLEVMNRGATNVYIETAPGGIVAGVETCSVAAVVAVAGGATGSYCVEPGQCKIIKRAPGDTHICAIGDAAGPSILRVSQGNGI